MPEFLRQDYHTYSRLKRKWRRPKGHQSKLRVNKGGSGVRPRVGFGTKKEKIHVITNLSDLEKVKGRVLLASGIGAKKAAEMAKRANELGITILNKRKLKRYEKIVKNLEKKKIRKTEIKKEKEAKEIKAEMKEEKIPKEETEKKDN
mgnify:CR=1 FL=1